MERQTQGGGRAIRLAIVGTGRSAAELVRATQRRSDCEIVAAITSDEARAGRDLGELTVGERIGVETTTGLDDRLAHGGVDLVAYVGSGEIDLIVQCLETCADRGVDAITTAGLTNPAAALGEEGAEALAARARDGGARLLGTGVNPGFLLDTLVITMAQLVSAPTEVRADRVSEIAAWSDFTLDSMVGLGRPPEEVTPSHEYDLRGPLDAVGRALGLEFDEIESERTALKASSPRSQNGRSVPAGATVGFLSRASGMREGAPLATLQWRGVFGAAADGVATGSRVSVRGESTVETSCAGSFLEDPYPATAARALNAIAPLRSMPPGLYRPDQIPLGAGPVAAHPPGGSENPPLATEPA